MALDVSVGTTYLGDLEHKIHSYETLSQLLPPKCKVILAAAENEKAGREVISIAAGTSLSSIISDLASIELRRIAKPLPESAPAA